MAIYRGPTGGDNRHILFKQGFGGIVCGAVIVEITLSHVTMTRRSPEGQYYRSGGSRVGLQIGPYNIIQNSLYKAPIEQYSIMTSRHWLVTVNNPTEEIHSYLRRLYDTEKVSYIIGQMEEGESGTPHIQYCVTFKEPARMAKLQKFDSKAHYEKCDNVEASRKYCSDRTKTTLSEVEEFGSAPVQRNSKNDWDEVRKNAEEGKFDKIPSDILIRNYSNLRRVHADSTKVHDSEQTRGVWLWGPSGSGKSHFARTYFTEVSSRVFIKPQSKWWDGYTEEPVVILDDLDSDCLSHYLKIWADKYGCRGEIKGSTIALKHKVLVVTSNYAIHELFGKKDETT